MDGLGPHIRVWSINAKNHPLLEFIIEEEQKIEAFYQESLNKGENNFLLEIGD